MAMTATSYGEALTLARSNGGPLRISNALYNLSFLQVWANIDKDPATRVADAEAEIDEALALARQAGDRSAIARCLWGKANITNYLRNDFAAALVPLEEAIPIFRELGDVFSLAWAVHSQGLVRLRTGDLPAARAAFDEQAALLGEARDPSGLAIALGNMAQLAHAEGDQLRAIRLAGASAALRHMTGAELVSKIDAVEGRVVEATPENQGAWREGLAMTLDQALAYALRKA
jgi:tetratricopeptide (TPR) repeat protein